MNPLYQQMQPQQGNNLLQRFQQFRQQFQGDPRQQVQSLLNSGKVSQDQYNNAVRMAQQFQKMFGIK
jgi:hypothetical protein